MAKIENCVFLDLETRSKRDIGDGAFAYAADESTEVLLAGYCIENQDYVCTDNIESDNLQLKPLFKAIQDGFLIVAHNMLFEIACYKYLLTPKYGWPKPKLEQFRCTMQMASRAGLPMALGGAAKALHLTDKLEEGKALIKLFSIPQNDGSFIEMDSRPSDKKMFVHYCGIDNVVCRDIWSNLPAFTEEEEEDILLDLKSNLYGVHVDTETAIKVYDNVLEVQAGFAARATELTGGIITKMTQVQRLKKWIIQYVNEEVPNCAADTIIDLLDGKYGEVDTISKELLEMRQHSGKSSTGKYVRIINSSIDDYVYGMLISFGTNTGRMISKLLNLANLPKPSVDYESADALLEDLSVMDIDGINEKYGSYLKAASSAIRGLIIAPKGKVFCIADYASIEARLVFWLARCKKGLQTYHDGLDMYIEMATVIFAVPYDKVTSDQRWVGKTAILGAGFGLGWKGFQNTCINYGRELSDDLCKDSIGGYRDAFPEVVQSWDDMDRKAMMACKTGKVTYACDGLIAFKTSKTKSGVTFLFMKLPSGRLLSYPDIKIVKAITPWGASRKSVSYKKLVNNQWVRETTYGGKLYENAIQAIARDLMYYGAKNAVKNGYRVIFSVYDEVISEIDEDKADIKHYEELLSVTPEWGVGMPLEAEGKICNRYQKI